MCASALFLAQITRILAHQAPTEQEAWLTASIYVPWIYFCWRDSEQLENHYAVTFYASCGAFEDLLYSDFGLFGMNRRGFA